MPHRDYSHQDLRNRSFKNQDLTEADFSQSDLRSCDFTGAILTRANFQGCKTGQSQRQLITYFAFAFAISVAFLIFVAVAGGFAVATSVYVSSATAVAVAVSLAISVYASFSFSSFASFSGIITIAVTGFGIGSVSVVAIEAFSRGAVLKGIAYSLLSLLLFGFGSYGCLKQIKSIANQLGSNFKNANLSHASFRGATLQNIDFSGATLDWVNWTGVRFSRCQFPRNLEETRVIALCVRREGSSQDYSYAQLKNLDLQSVNLIGANIASANLNGADLRHANLTSADLANTQALRTDFSEANLTGACIQNWGINSDTKFTNVRCDYIYLEPNQQERKPASGIFQPSDFEKLVHQFTTTLDFLFRNGIDPEAFDFALKNLLIDYEDAGLSMHSVVDVGDDDRLVRFNRANPNVDPGAMHAQFSEDYAFMQIQLGEAREQNQLLEKDLAHVKGQIAIYEKHDTLWSIVLGRSTISIQDSQIGEFMADKSNKVEIGKIGGDASGISGGDNSGVAGKNITGAAGGDISGTLAISLKQLEDSQDPQALKLAELLKQVKTAIEKSDSGLSEADQQKALKHLETISKLGTDPKNPDLLEKAGDALDALPTIIKRGNNLAEFAEKYLPTFTAGVKAIFSVWGVAL